MTVLVVAPATCSAAVESAVAPLGGQKVWDGAWLVPGSDGSLGGALDDVADALSVTIDPLKSLLVTEGGFPALQSLADEMASAVMGTPTHVNASSAFPGGGFQQTVGGGIGPEE
ncbi:hypothetical protein [Brevundimonas sp. FT23028]|uniref:hypothetical protein n=1 Tax=Brevundimonas sp. FT23028 TaxID=3393748 RepID=UPI003B587612